MSGNTASALTTIGLVLIVLAIVVAVPLGISSGISGYYVNRDVGGWEYRAQVSSDAEDMAIYISNTIDGVEKWGLTKGHCSLFFPKPSNNLELGYAALQRMQERASLLSGLEKSSTAYQTGLDDLRGSLREFEPPTFHCAVVTSRVWMLMLWWFALGVFVVGLVVVTWVGVSY